MCHHWTQSYKYHHLDNDLNMGAYYRNVRPWMIPRKNIVVARMDWIFDKRRHFDNNLCKDFHVPYKSIKNNNIYFVLLIINI